MDDIRCLLCIINSCIIRNRPTRTKRDDTDKVKQFDKNLLFLYCISAVTCKQPVFLYNKHFYITYYGNCTRLKEVLNGVLSEFKFLNANYSEYVFYLIINQQDKCCYFLKVVIFIYNT